METRESVFASARPMLFAIAYRMLGSVMDAEDLVHDAGFEYAAAHAMEVEPKPRSFTERHSWA